MNFEQVMVRYEAEIARLTRRAVLAEAEVEALRTQAVEDQTD